MGETGRKKQRKKDSIKKTEDLLSIPRSTDPQICAAQLQHCKAIVSETLQDEQALSFSKPVDELWGADVLTDYFEKIKHPMDLGTVQNNLNTDAFNSENGFFDANLFRFQLRLVFLNAMEYNQRGTDLHRLASKFIHFTDSKLAKIPLPSMHSNSELHNGTTTTTSASASASVEKASSLSKKEKLKPEHVVPKQQSPHDDQPPQQSPAQKEHHQDDTENLKSLIASFEKKKAKSQALLEQLDSKRNTPLSFEENSKLRDDVEKLPWEVAQKVVDILRQYVDDALEQMSEEDPEFVTLEFSTVEPTLLRDIESLVRPNAAREKELRAMESYDEQIATAKRKLRMMEDGESVKKKARRRR